MLVSIPDLLERKASHLEPHHCCSHKCWPLEPQNPNPGPIPRDVTEDRPAKEAPHSLQVPMHHLPVEVVDLIFEQFVLAAGRTLRSPCWKNSQAIGGSYPCPSPKTTALESSLIKYFATPMFEKLRIELVTRFFGGRTLFLSPGVWDLILSFISIDWNNFTYPYNFCPDELIWLLQSASNLEICTVQGTSRFLEHTLDALTIRNTLITHSKLHTFTLIVDEESSRQSFGRLFYLVNFPSLRTLKYDYSDAPNNVQMPILRTVIPFAYKSATSLANFKVSRKYPPHSSNFLIVLLQAMKKFQTLAISHCSSFISGTFFEQFEGGRFLPSLRIFNYIASQSFSWTSFKKMLPRMDTPPQGVAAVSANLSMVLSTKNDPQQL